MIRIRHHGEVLACVRHANTFWTRMVGLLSTPHLEPGEGLLIEPCNSVHMLGMRYPLDIVFLDRAGVVVALETLRPWEVGRVHWKANRAIELVAGELSRHGVNVGDTLELEQA